MPDLIRSAQAGAAGTALITLNEVPNGLVWVISQVSVEAQTTNVAVVATMRKNSRYITSTNQGQASSAGGQPFIRLRSGDVFTIDWAGLNLNDVAIVTVLYNEVPWHQSETLSYQVV